MALDDPSERFQLPQVRETVKGLLDALSIFLPGFPPPSDYEVEAISKPAATLLARRPHIQNAVKKYAAPGVLAGAIGAYFIPRLNGMKQQSLIRAARENAGRHLRAVQDQPSADAPPPQASTIAAQPPEAQEPRPSPAQAAAIAQFTQSILDQQRAGIPG